MRRRQQGFIVNPFMVAAAGGGGGGGGAFLVDAANFDGSNDYLKRVGFVGAADSKLLTMSWWMRVDTWNNARRLFMSKQSVTMHAFETQTTDNRFFIQLKDTAGSVRMEAYTGTLAVATPYHFLLSIDMSDTAKRHLYVNDASNVTWQNYADHVLDFTYTDWSIGGNPDGGALFDAQLAEFYFAPGQYIDFSVQANRRLFRSATGKPVSLGADGSVPTGVAPKAYLHLDDGETANNFRLNRGTGGDFTLIGTLDTGSWSPSD